MKPIRLYISKKQGDKCLYTDNELRCSKCDNPLNGGYYVEAYSKILPAFQATFCGHCKDSFPKGYDVVNTHIVVAGHVPDNKILWDSTPPTLVSSRDRGDVFIAAVTDDGSKVVDNTVNAGRLSLEGASVGLLSVDVRDPDGDDFLLALTARPIIPKQLEDNR